MPTLMVTDEQVIDLVRQLPAERKRTVLLALAQGAYVRREARMEYAAGQLRHLCAERGLDWDAMSEEERQLFIDDLLYRELERQHAEGYARHPVQPGEFDVWFDYQQWSDKVTSSDEIGNTSP